MIDDEIPKDRAGKIAESAWQQWTRGGLDVVDGADNHETLRLISKAVIESYIEGMTDGQWLQATMEWLELERGGTPT